MTGREGQVARCLSELALTMPTIELIKIGRPDFDLAKPETIRHAVAASQADVVVSAAAYTAVDQAEEEKDLAYAVNAEAPGALAAAARELGAPIIHLSTDYVFRGDKEGPYTESDKPAPQSVYGASKLAGEDAVASANPEHIILRTAWVYSPYGKNFVKTMMRVAAERDEISVVSDQWGNPTSALEIAAAILHVATSDEHISRRSGIYHLVGSGSASWASFARHILETSRRYGGPYAAIKSIATQDYPTKAPRPANSQLDVTKFSRAFKWSVAPWQHSVERVVRRLLSVEGDVA